MNFEIADGIYGNGRYTSSHFINKGGYAYFWSSTEQWMDKGANIIRLDCAFDDAKIDIQYKSQAFSVRCVME